MKNKKRKKKNEQKKNSSQSQTISQSFGSKGKVFLFFSSQFLPRYRKNKNKSLLKTVTFFPQDVMFTPLACNISPANGKQMFNGWGVLYSFCCCRWPSAWRAFSKSPAGHLRCILGITLYFVPFPTQYHLCRGAQLHFLLPPLQQPFFWWFIATGWFKSHGCYSWHKSVWSPKLEEQRDQTYIIN